MPQTVLLRKSSQKGTGAVSRGCKFHVLKAEVLRAVDEVHDKVDKVQADMRTHSDDMLLAVARIELTMQAVLETSCTTGRLVEALALGELDCPKYVYVVPDVPPGGWKKGAYWFHSLHATQVHLMLACAHDFQVVRCGPDGRGYPIKIEKDWVQSFFRTFGPVLKIGLFAARAAVLASGVGAFTLPFLPHAHLRGETVTDDMLGEALHGQSEHMHQLHLIDEMLGVFGEMAGEGAEAAEASEEMHDLIEKAEKRDQPLRLASTTLQAWTASSYRSLRALLCEHDPQLLHTGLVQVIAGGASEWVAPENAAAWKQQRQEEEQQQQQQQQRQRQQQQQQQQQQHQ